jgi:3-deoxy-7-phosphoheptulonate synthase
VAAAGARVIRACVWPTRVSPYGFRGLGESGLPLLRRAADRNSLFVLCEVLDASQIPAVSAAADVLMVGAGNMSNVALLGALGATRKPVLLKRGVSATLEELLLAAEVLLAGGNYQVALCERGIRTFASEQAMDLGAIPALKRLSHLPVLADPSHGTGRRDKVAPMARAAVAAGADGLLVEVHPEPDKALVDAGQSIRPEHFAELMAQLRLIGEAVGRSL